MCGDPKGLCKLKNMSKGGTKTLEFDATKSEGVPPGYFCVNQIQNSDE